MFSLVFIAFVAILVSGCGSPMTHQIPVGYRYTVINQSGPIMQSSLPPDPVRRSETSFTGFGHSYYHSQGTETRASKFSSPWGSEQSYEQRTWNVTQRSYAPGVYYSPPQVHYDYSGRVGTVYGGGGGDYIRGYGPVLNNPARCR